MTGRVQRAMCSGILGLQAVVLFLTTPVMISVTGLPTAVALTIGPGLTVACVLAAGLMGRPVGAALGWGIQVAAIALGFVITVMFALGVVFLGLYAGSWYLGQRIDRERSEREALG